MCEDLFRGDLNSTASVTWQRGQFSLTWQFMLMYPLWYLLTTHHPALTVLRQH